MTGKEAELAFVKLAKRLGYTQKVVGDYAYHKVRGKREIKLLGAKRGKLQILESGVQYEQEVE